MMTRMIATFAALALTASGCASTPGMSTPAVVEETTLKVTNQAFLDMNIYVVSGGQMSRLGTVNGNSTATLVIPRRLLSGPTSLRFQADPIGAARAPVTEHITVSPGDQVGMTIPPG